MASTRDRAICLRKVEYSETSQILTLFCRGAGLVRVIAKGAHRRTKAGAGAFDGGVDLLDLGDCVYIAHSSRDLATLTEWKLLEGHLALRTHLRAMLIGQYLAEIISLLLAEQDPHPLVFDRLQATLPALATQRIEEEFLAMQLDVLKEAGFLPDLSNPQTAGEARIDPRLLRIADTIQKLPRLRAVPQRLPRLTRHQADPLNAYFARHIEQIVQRPIRSARYIV